MQGSCNLQLHLRHQPDADIYVSEHGNKVPDSSTVCLNGTIFTSQSKAVIFTAAQKAEGALLCSQFLTASRPPPGALHLTCLLWFKRALVCLQVFVQIFQRGVKAVNQTLTWTKQHEKLLYTLWPLINKVITNNHHSVGEFRQQGESVDDAGRHPPNCPIREFPVSLHSCMLTALSSFLIKVSVNSKNFWQFCRQHIWNRIKISYYQVVFILRLIFH